VDVHDPWAPAAEAEREYGIRLTAAPETAAYDAILIAVAHRQFAELGSTGIRAFGKARHILYDLKYVLPRDAADLRL
jgi:UDP-N-acetyl-D-galactosamine dehydrogenase